MNLLSFQKPSRYINSELNSIHKEAAVRVALAFPDMYEIGMSHLGLRILYGIINSIPFASAERVFSPWPDLGDAMKQHGVLLSSLESGRPLREFDVLGFSLQYELSYTTVLDMLHLAGIPIKTEDRMERKDMPLVIAGGPCTLNPYPMVPFIDAFLIGDGEDAVGEILDKYYQWKKGDMSDRLPLLKALSEIEGVFVPSLGRERKVSRRIIASLEDAPFPDSPVLPYTGIIHDRVNIEIARGCSMGCRFCQAGMAYRPVRERSPEKVLELAERSLKNTGYEDISFTSLSSGDYSCLHQLMKEFNMRFGGKRISMSLPSLRVATVDRDILREIKAVRKTGFTIAPEAGTERLRAVINKDFSGETYANALETLFKEGWHNLKLYFMTGLPTETDEDIAAIPEMVLQAIKTSKRLTGRNVNISVGVSSFVPKPHTPFQWAGQNRLDLLREKNSYLKKALLRRGVKYKGHNEEMALLEAVFARGDESVSGLIESAWALGCRLDAWTELFDFEKWKQAMDVSKVDIFERASREYGPGDPLPWENISTGVTREYLRKEYNKAVSGEFTKDCRTTCHACGLKCPDDSRGGVTPPVRSQETGDSSGGVIPPLQEQADRSRNTEDRRQKDPSQEPFTRVRLQYAKTGRLRYLSHLELVRAMTRAMRRADLPLRYSAGFHPAPKLSFGPALGVGVAGLREYLDLELLLPFDLESGLSNLRRALPEGIRANMMQTLYGKEKSLNSFIIGYVYDIRDGDRPSVGKFLDRDEVISERKNGGINIKTMVEAVDWIDEETCRITVRDRDDLKVRLDELLPEMFGVRSEDLDITRIGMLGWQGTWVEPMEGECAWAVKS